MNELVIRRAICCRVQTGMHPWTVIEYLASNRRPGLKEEEVPPAGSTSSRLRVGLQYWKNNPVNHMYHSVITLNVQE